VILRYVVSHQWPSTLVNVSLWLCCWALMCLRIEWDISAMTGAVLAKWLISS